MISQLYFGVDITLALTIKWSTFNFNVEIKQLEKHPAFDKSVKMAELTKNDKSSTHPADESCDGALNLNLLEKSAPKVKEESK